MREITYLGLSEGLKILLNKLLFSHSTPFRKAKALYACKAEHDSELSFTAGTVFDNGEFLIPLQSCGRGRGAKKKKQKL